MSYVILPKVTSVVDQPAIQTGSTDTNNSGQSTQVSRIPGPKGDPGPQGPRGPAGPRDLRDRLGTLHSFSSEISVRGARVDSTGIDLGQVDVREYFDQFNVVDPSTDDCHDALAAADTAAAAAGRTLRIVGTVNLDTDITLSAHTEFAPGAKFTGAGVVTFATGSTLTCGDNAVVFAGAAPVIPSSARRYVTPQMFGASRGDDVTDDTAAFQAAVNSGPPVRVPDPDVAYAIAGTITMAAGAVLRGSGKRTCILHKSGADTGPIVWIKGDRCTLEDFKLHQDGSHSPSGILRVGPEVSGDGIMLGVTVARVWIRGDADVSSEGLSLTRVSGAIVNYFAMFHDCYIEYVGKGCTAIDNCNGIGFHGVTMAHITTNAWYFDGALENKVIGGFIHQSNGITCIVLVNASQFNAFIGHIPEPGGVAVAFNWDATTIKNMWVGPLNCAGGYVDNGTDNSVIENGRVAGSVFKTNDGGTKTIASGAIAIRTGRHNVDTEGAAASDDLNQINGGTGGMTLVLRAANSARVVTVKHTDHTTTLPDGSVYTPGNIKLAGGADFALTGKSRLVLHTVAGTEWEELSRATIADDGASTEPGYLWNASTNASDPVDSITDTGLIGSNLTATLTARPARGTVNGLASALFDNSNDLMTGDTTKTNFRFLHGGTGPAATGAAVGCTVFVVLKRAAHIDTDTILDTGIVDATSTGVLLVGVSGSTNIALTLANGSGTYMTNGHVLGTSADGVVSVIWYTVDGTQFQGGVNKTAVAAVALTGSPNDADSTGNLLVGSRPASASFNGDICEVVIYNEVLSAPAINAAVDVFQAQWGTS